MTISVKAEFINAPDAICNTVPSEGILLDCKLVCKAFVFVSIKQLLAI
jgi:hypothetical protein